MMLAHLLGVLLSAAAPGEGAPSSSDPAIAADPPSSSDGSDTDASTPPAHLEASAPGEPAAAAPSASDDAATPPPLLDESAPEEPAAVPPSASDDAATPVPPTDDATVPRPTRTLSARYLSCRKLLIDDESPAIAAACFTSLADEGGPEAELAREMAELARAVEARRVVRDPSSGNASAASRRFLTSGAPEGLVAGGLYGGVGGFLATAVVQSYFRTDTSKGFIFLLGVPAAGIVVGAALGAGVGLIGSPGDAALVSASTWAGTAWGTAIQFLLLNQNDDVRAIPLRFLIPLSAGLATGLAAGVAAPFVDVSPGDAALATSAGVWAPLLLLLGGFTLVNVTEGISFDMNTTVAALTASSVAAWGITLALFPLLDLPRPTTWLIDLGGVAGAIATTAFLPILGIFALGGVVYPTATFPALYTVGIGAGLAAGTAGAFVAAHGFDLLEGLPLAQSPLALSPYLAPDPTNPRATMVGLGVSGGFSL